MAPSLYDRFEVIAGLPTEGVAERAALLAALQWAGPDGVLRPSIPTWARTAGMNPRAFRRVVIRLAERGLLRVVKASRGGPRATTRYAIPALANPDPGSGLEPGPGVPPTRTGEPSNPDPKCPQPGPGVRGTTKNNQENNQQQGAADDVLSRLGIQDLRCHPNATPDRLKWIEREAPGKSKPAGWAADNIRKGWTIPPPTMADEAVRRKARRAELWSQFRNMTGAERTEVLATARQQFPNLRIEPDDSPGVRGAICQVLAARDEQDSRVGGAA